MMEPGKRASSKKASRKPSRRAKARRPEQPLRAGATQERRPREPTVAKLEAKVKEYITQGEHELARWTHEVLV